jgi:hypothetical protein
MSVGRTEVDVALGGARRHLVVGAHACVAKLAQRLVDVGDAETDRSFQVRGRVGRGDSERQPSGIANTSASMPPAGAGARPSTSRTNSAISGRASVLVPTNVTPSILINQTFPWNNSTDGR